MRCFTTGWVRALLAFMAFAVAEPAAAQVVATSPDDARAVLDGRKLSAGEAAELERALEAAPDDIGIRIRLLGYAVAQRSDGSAARRRHTELSLWFIRNAPEEWITGSPFASLLGPRDEDGWEEAREAWFAHLDADPHNLAILWNAASFLSLKEPETAAALFERGAGLDPANAWWSMQLGRLAEQSARRGAENATERARLALERYEEAWALSDLSGRDGLLQELAWAAFEAGEAAKAREYAEAMLVDYPHERNLADHTHHGNLVLGRLALAEGEIGEAGDRLLAAANLESGSPVLGSFGPEMGLAKLLLERGEREIVLEYFRRCGRFWEHGQDKLAEWTRAVEAGETPDFGHSVRR